MSKTQTTIRVVEKTIIEVRELPEMLNSLKNFNFCFDFKELI